MQNGYIESFNGRMRDELLNESLFTDLDQARQLISAYRLQHCTATLFARLQNAGGLCRYTHRAERRNIGRSSNRQWMKVQWHVRSTENAQGDRAPCHTSRPNIRIKKTIHATVTKGLAARMTTAIQVPARDTADPSLFKSRTGSWIIGCVR